MADSENRRLLIEEMMAPKADGVSPIVTMMKDQYASESSLEYILRVYRAHSCTRLCPSTCTDRRRGRAERHAHLEDQTTIGDHAAILERIQQTPYFQ